MIIHKLIAHHLHHQDDQNFYLLQATDASAWLEKSGVTFHAGMSVLDLGCGHGVFGRELLRRKCHVVFADEANFLLTELKSQEFRQINIDKQDISTVGRYDLVVCSNVLEHLANPTGFIEAIPNILTPEGKMYLSWTNWLSPWGGHEFSPFHYLGPHWGPRLFETLLKRERKH